MLSCLSGNVEMMKYVIEELKLSPVVTDDVRI
jgi:hypothetical protein